MSNKLLRSFLVAAERAGVTHLAGGDLQLDDEPIVKNAVACRICGAAADRWTWGFQCQAAPGHQADLNTGIFSDMTYPG